MFGGSGNQAKQPEAIKAIRIQTSVYGAARTIMYGTARVTPNMIWYNDFTATSHTENQGGGK